MTANRKITYLYRDAGNYKYWNDFVVAGDMSLTELQQYLLEGEFFVPEKIGVQSLVPQKRNSDDHMLHEFHSIELVGLAPHLLTAAELVERLRKANNSGWF